MINNWQQHNESWRQVKAWLQIPQILIEMLISKMVDFVPQLTTTYKSMSARVDNGTSFNSGPGQTMKEEPIKLEISDIKNDKIRNTLKLTGIFDEWNIYTFDRLSHDKRQPIYISKDELTKGCKYFGSRISDTDVDSNYGGKKQKRFLKSKNVSDLNELEPQFWIICATYSERHKEMGVERKNRYENKERKSLEKKTKKAINEADWGRIYVNSTHNPIAHILSESGRVDLMQDLIDAIIEIDGEEEVIKILTQVVDNDGWIQNIKYKDSSGYRQVIDFAKTDEMKELINNTIKELS